MLLGVAYSTLLRFAQSLQGITPVSLIWYYIWWIDITFISLYPKTQYYESIKFQ